MKTLGKAKFIYRSILYRYAQFTNQNQFGPGWKILGLTVSEYVMLQSNIYNQIVAQMIEHVEDTSCLSLSNVPSSLDTTGDYFVGLYDVLVFFSKCNWKFQ